MIDFLLPHAYAVEYIEFLFALSLLIFCILNLWNSLLDLQANFKYPGGYAIAQGQMIKGIGYLVTAGLFFSISWAGLLRPPPATAVEFMDRAQLTTPRLFFMLLTVTQMAYPVMDRITRRRVLDLLERRHLIKHTE